MSPLIAFDDWLIDRVLTRLFFGLTVSPYWSARIISAVYLAFGVNDAARERSLFAAFDALCVLVLASGLFVDAQRAERHAESGRSTRNPVRITKMGFRMTLLEMTVLFAAFEVWNGVEEYALLGLGQYLCAIDWQPPPARALQTA